MKPITLVSHLAVLLIGGAIGFFIAKGNSADSKTISEPKAPIEQSVEEPTPPEPPVEKPEKVTPPKPLQPLADNCFAGEDQLSTQLTLFSEQIEKKKLWYDYKNPEDFLDNSGIFHRVVEFVKSKCENYDYPGQEQRGINVPKWYAARDRLIVIKSREDGIAKRNLIKPGAVMFFGNSGQSYSNLTLDQVTTDGANKVIYHIGVVTEVNKDKDGKVTGYVMMHGRGDGKIAQRTHYHSLKPAGYGMPPLGNYNQQWVAIAQDIRAVQTDMVQQEKPSVHKDIPVSPGGAALVAENAPDDKALSCFDFDFDTFFPDKVIKPLEAQKIGYKIGEHADCSGMVFRVCEKFAAETNGSCTGSFVTPCESGYKDSRNLARWYYEKRNLQVVTDPKSMGDLIQIGSVMFFGQRGTEYASNVSINDLEIRGKGIEHVGVVVDVKKENGKVVAYELFHGHGSKGDPADITKPSKGKSQYLTNDRKAFSYWGQQWVAIAPNLLTSSP